MNKTFTVISMALSLAAAPALAEQPSQTPPSPSADDILPKSEFREAAKRYSAAIQASLKVSDDENRDYCTNPESDAVKTAKADAEKAAIAEFNALSPREKEIAEYATKASPMETLKKFGAENPERFLLAAQFGATARYFMDIEKSYEEVAEALAKTEAQLCELQKSDEKPPESPSPRATASLSLTR